MWCLSVRTALGFSIMRVGFNSFAVVFRKDIESFHRIVSKLFHGTCALLWSFPTVTMSQVWGWLRAVIQALRNLRRGWRVFRELRINILGLGNLKIFIDPEQVMEQG